MIQSDECPGVRRDSGQPPLTGKLPSALHRFQSLQALPQSPFLEILPTVLLFIPTLLW